MIMSAPRRQVLAYINNNPRLTNMQLCDALNRDSSVLRRHTAWLYDEGLINRKQTKFAAYEWTASDAGALMLKAMRKADEIKNMKWRTVK